MQRSLVTVIIVLVFLNSSFYLGTPEQLAVHFHKTHVSSYLHTIIDINDIPHLIQLIVQLNSNDWSRIEGDG